jgi:hydroxypyruvate reductase
VAEAADHGARVLELAHSLTEHDFALVLISGGGSAMLELPIPGISISDIRETTRVLLLAGADIAELNAVRGCLSQLKAGGLARALHPAKTLAILISDVPGRDPSLVAAGPCSSPSGWPNPKQVIASHELASKLEANVRHAIAQSVPRSLPNDWQQTELVIAADVQTAIDGVRAEALRHGLTLHSPPRVIHGVARIEGPRFVRDAQTYSAEHRVDGWIAGSETTVNVRGSGRGGRNSEAVLATVDFDASVPGTFIAIATDGVDGSSDAAAVWMNQDIADRAQTLRLDPKDLLDRNDSHAFFASTGAQLVVGPTGTNVADVWIWLANHQN